MVVHVRLANVVFAYVNASWSLHYRIDSNQIDCVVVAQKAYFFNVHFTVFVFIVEYFVWEQCLYGAVGKPMTYTIEFGRVICWTTKLNCLANITIYMHWHTAFLNEKCSRSTQTDIYWLCGSAFDTYTTTTQAYTCKTRQEPNPILLRHHYWNCAALNKPGKYLFFSIFFMHLVWQ